MESKKTYTYTRWALMVVSLLGIVLMLTTVATNPETADSSLISLYFLLTFLILTAAVLLFITFKIVDLSIHPAHKKEGLITLGALGVGIIISLIIPTPSLQNASGVPVSQGFSYMVGAAIMSIPVFIGLALVSNLVTRYRK